MNDVTRILVDIDRGETVDTDGLLPLVYDELRGLAASMLAREKPGQTLQATALVHEAYIRLVDSEKVRSWNSRGHFFAAAAEAMRRILINRARDKKRLKRGGGRQRLDLNHVDVSTDTHEDDLVALDDVIEKLAKEDPLCARLVKLRVFAGLTLGECAESLGISRRTADRFWAYARAWLYDRLRQGGRRG